MPAISKAQLTEQILALNQQNLGFYIAPEDQELTVWCEFLAAKMLGGEEQLSYRGHINIDESKGCVFFKERFVEKSKGFQMFKVESESYSIKGKELSGRKKGKIWAQKPDGAFDWMDYEMDFGRIRETIKQLIQSYGWAFQMKVF
jgi:hypothetical protein